MARLKSLRSKSGGMRSLGVLLSLFDPRTYIQLARLLHYVNYSHAGQVGRIRKGSDVRIAPNVSIANGEFIRLGSHVRIAEHATLWAAEDGSGIEIEDWAAIGPHTFVTAAKYQFKNPASGELPPPQGGTIHIGRGAVVYSCCIILAGSRIGEGAIIAPGSLVNGEIPAHAIAMGSPARVVLQRGPED